MEDEDFDIYFEDDDDDFDDEFCGPDDFYDDAEALASAGMGTDEDYGYFGGDDF